MHYPKKSKTLLKLLFTSTILLSLSCDGELEDCVEVICDGPDNTNCREEPVLDSDCFPRETVVELSE